MVNKTINQFDTITSLGSDDVILGFDVGSSTTVKIPVSSIVSLVSSIASGGEQVTASAVASVGAVMDSDFSVNGFIKRTSAGSYSTVTIIQPTEVSGLAAVATAGTLNSLTDVSTPTPASNQYLRYNGTEWVPTSLPASSITFTGFRAADGASISVSSVAVTIVPATVDFDTLNCYSSTTGRYTPNVAGKYRLNFRATYSCAVASQVITIDFKKNNNFINSTNFQHLTSPVAGGTQALEISETVSMNGSTDFVYAYANGTGTNIKTVNPISITATYLGA